jgi:diguanylate cyclase (GGDEF)-like protein
MLRIWALALLATMPVRAQLNTSGLPFITNHHGEGFPGDPQVWAIVQDSRGILYLGNSVGLLEFDGQEWRTVVMPNRSTVRSLAVDSADRVWIGAIGEIGYVTRRANGTLEYQSLLSTIPESDRVFEYVWRTQVVGDAVTFVTGEALFVYRQGRMSVVRAPGRLQNSFRVGDELYVYGSAIGLARLVGDRLDPIPDCARFSGDRIYAVLPYQGSTRMVVSRTGGVFLLDLAAPAGAALRKDTKFAALDALLASSMVYCGALLASDSIALGTVKAGLLLVDRDGHLLQRLDKAKGLRSDTILTILVDPRDNLWLGTSNGAAYIETGAPFGVIDERQGIVGHGYSACVVPDAQARGGKVLYLGSVGGVYRRDIGDVTGRFEPLPNTAEGWSLQVAHDVVLCAQNAGVVEVRGRSVRSVVEGRIFWTFAPVPGQPNLMLVGAIDGLALLEWRDGAWQNAGNISGFGQSSRSLIASEDGTVWVAHRNKGVFRVTVDYASHRATEVRRYDSTDGLPSDLETSVSRLGEHVLFATLGGLYRYDQLRDRFEPDPLFADLPWQNKAIESAVADSNGNVWYRALSEMGVILRRDDGSYMLGGAALRRLRSLRIPAIVPIEAGHVIFGTSEGFVDYPAALAEERKVPFPTLLRRVECPANGRTFEVEPARGGLPAQPSQLREARVPPDSNQLRFVFAAAFHDGTNSVEFSCRLESPDDAWSPWSTVLERTYSGLGGGRYVFHVKARDIYGIEAEEAQFPFTVLTPVYRQPWAIALYVLAAIGLVLGIVKLYTRRLEREKNQLEALVAQRTEELHEATLRDPLTGLRNRRFLAEVVEPEAQSFLARRQHMLQASERRRQDLEGSVFGLYMLDLDHFKAVNDRYGHAAGDLVLRAFSTLLRRSTRQDDFVIRWGGEEFLIVLVRTAPDYADRFSTLIRERIESTPFAVTADGSETTSQTCSIGYVAVPFFPDAPDLVTLDQTIALADIGLAHAKEHGRNLVVKVVAGEVRPSPEEIPLLLASPAAAIEGGMITLLERR